MISYELPYTSLNQGSPDAELTCFHGKYPGTLLTIFPHTTQFKINITYVLI